MLGAAGADTFYVGGAAALNSVAGSAGTDSLVFAGTSTSDTLVMGDGNDTLDVTGVAHTMSLLGGEGADSVDFTANVSKSMLNGGAGNDTFNFGAVVSSSSVIGGTGDDSLVFASAMTTAGKSTGVNVNQTTLYFGTNSGNDTLNISALSSTTAPALTIAYDSTLGAAMAVGYTNVSTSGDNSTLTLGSTKVFITGLTQSNVSAIAYIGVSTDDLTTLGA